MFKALLLTKPESGFCAALAEIDEAQLPADADVLVRVEYSTINYKDGLAICNAAPVVRQWPMVAGIDGAGVVDESNHADWKPGDRFILNGWGVGESHWGCLAEKARLKASWLIPAPPLMSTREAMAIGTAGYTAMLAVMALDQHGVKPEQGEILVTGAAGGVGSIAIALLGQRGFKVVASTGRLEETDYLKSLGASSVESRDLLNASGKALQRERWAAVIDCVGSHTLANACAQVRYDGVVAACGLAQGMDLNTSVAPFILRGVSLLGINSVSVPYARRVAAWQRLSSELDSALLERISCEVPLDQAIDVAAKILQGKVRGRVIINCAK